MITNTSTLCSIASALIKCIQDTWEYRDCTGRRGRLGLSRGIETTNGAAYISVDMVEYAHPDFDYNESSISIEIDNRLIFKIKFKYINDWKLDAFIDNSNKNLILLDVASEALIKMMMDMVHATSIFPF